MNLAGVDPAVIGLLRKSDFDEVFEWAEAEPEMNSITANFKMVTMSRNGIASYSEGVLDFERAQKRLVSRPDGVTQFFSDRRTHPEQVGGGPVLVGEGQPFDPNETDPLTI